MNVWQNLGVTYFQVPDSIVTSGTLAKLKGTSMRLYLLILSVAQRKSRPTVELTVKDIADATGMNRRHVDGAAQELQKCRLVDVVRHKGNKWGYEFHLLDPETRLALPTVYKRELNAANLSKSQMESYFLHHLGQNFNHFDDNGIWARCPFHTYLKPKPTLSIRTVGTSATWRCTEPECHHEGGSIIDFEIAMSRLKGKSITGSNAWQKIVHIIKAAERKQAIEKDAGEDFTIDIQASAYQPEWDVLDRRCYILYHRLVHFVTSVSNNPLSISEFQGHSN